MNGQTLAISQNFLYYKGLANDNEQASGAYIFRPIDNEALVVSETVQATTVSGNLVDEIRQVVNDWVTQIIRIYKGESDNYVEFDWLVGPIEV